MFKRRIRIPGHLSKSPQRKAIVQKLTILPPRRPNSARRKTARCKFNSGSYCSRFMRKYILSYIPGIGHNLKKNSKVLIRGRGARDLPCVYTSCIRGSLDLSGVLGRSRRKSIYGCK